MTTYERTASLVALCLLLSTGCGERTRTAATTAPVEPTATASLDPPELRIGDTATVEITVMAPPDLQLQPVAPPAPPVGLEILAIETIPAERRAGVRIDRTRVKLRARDTGSFEWPATDLVLTGANQAATTLSAGPLPIFVRSVLPGYPGRGEPFGARAAPERSDEASPIAAVGTGIAIGLGLLGLTILALRRRRGREVRSEARTSEPAWTEALDALGRTARTADETEAANSLTATLRRYMWRRFGANTDSLTTEELADATPPFAATSRWPVFVSLLVDLDAFRFRPRQQTEIKPASTSQVGSLQSRIRAFVEDTTPPEALR